MEKEEANSMSSEGTGRTQDVVVVADYHSHLPPALELAIALAGSRHAALRGLFIEDADLAMVSALPFLQEVTLTGARPRALEQQRLHRSFDNVSRRFQQLLSEAADRASLAYSFGTVAGRRQALEFGGDLEAGYLVLGQPGSSRPARHHALRVLLAQVDIEAALPVLACLQNLRGDRQIELLVLENGASPSFDARLAEFLPQHGNINCRRLPAGRLPDIFRRSGHPPELVIASRRCSPGVLKNLLELSVCPVILATQTSPAERTALIGTD